MTLVTDPDRHPHLIALQKKVFTLFAELEDYDGDDREGMREQVRQAVTEKETALYASGLVEEHGYFTASQDLMKATRTTMAS